MHTAHRVRSLCTGLGLALALLLSTAGTAAAGPAETPRAAWVVEHPVRLFVEWLTSVWGIVVPPPAGTEGLDAGCTADPSGGSCHGNG